MESSQGTSMVEILKSAKLVVIAVAIGVVIFILNKFGAFKGKTEADKLKEATEAKNEEKAIEFKQSDVLQPIKISDFSKTGVGAAEMKNQFPYSPKEVTKMITTIYKDKPFAGYSDGKNTIAVVNNLPSKFAFTRLASSFSDIYGDLMTWMDSNLHESAIAAVKRSMDLKPDFVKVLPATDAFLKKTNQKLTL